MAKAAANLTRFALVLQGVLKSKKEKEEKEEEEEEEEEEVGRSRKAHQKAKKKRPVQPGPEPQEAAMSLEGRIAVFEKNENQGLAQR